RRGALHRRQPEGRPVRRRFGQQQAAQVREALIRYEAARRKISQYTNRAIGGSVGIKSVSTLIPAETAPIPPLPASRADLQISSAIGPATRTISEPMNQTKDAAAIWRNDHCRTASMEEPLRPHDAKKPQMGRLN